MKLYDLLYESDTCEIVYCDADGEILTEGAVRQFQRQGTKIVRKYRCTTGPKAGKLVSTPAACSQRKDPKKVRQGRKNMRAKKGIIQRKGRITKNKSMNKIVAKMNKRMMGTP